MKHNDLSKEISYALRHAPHEYGLCLDEYGWVEVDSLVSALQQQECYASLTVGEIEKMIQCSRKTRHELSNGKIRARYGHSVKVDMSVEPSMPPDVLYHGTAHRFLKNIRDEGLLPVKRQYVHLSEDTETAIAVGKRWDHSPAILTINSRQAWEDGISFYNRNDKVWMVDKMPPSYIEMI